MTFDFDGGKPWKDAQEVLDDENADEEEKRDLLNRFLFDEDGIMKTVAPIPVGASKEEVEEAVAAGKIALYDDGREIFSKAP